MKNLTLRVDEKTLDGARKVAAEQDTSVNALVRDYLSDLAKRKDRRIKARKELIALCKNSRAEVGDVTWSRDELHAR